MIAPDGAYSGASPQAWLEFADHTVLPLRSYEWTEEGEFEAVFPLIESALGRIGATASGPDGAHTLVERTFAAATDEAELVLIEAVHLLGPDDGASPRPTPRETELRFPSIDGIDLTASASCRWRVLHLHGPAYEDDASTLPPASARGTSVERSLVPAP